MKILITGVAGFLGSHLAERMLVNGHDVFGVDNLEGGYLHNIPEKVHFVQGDCLDLELMTRITKGCEIVCHAACTAYEGLSVFSPSYVTQNTFQNTVSTLSAAIQNGVRRFVYCSSMARYGKQDQSPYEEEMICCPQDPYGIAKYAAENVVQLLAQAHKMEYIILIPHNIIGPRQCYEDPYRNVASIMINRLLQNKPPIIYSDGEQKRCFSFISDVISCFETALLDSELNGEIINVGPDEQPVTINTLCQTICHLLGTPFKPIYVNARPLEIREAICSADKARRLLNYQTQVSLEEGLISMIDYIQSKGAKPFKYNRPLEIQNSFTPKTWLNRLL